MVNLVGLQHAVTIIVHSDLNIEAAVGAVAARWFGAGGRECGEAVHAVLAVSSGVTWGTVVAVRACGPSRPGQVDECPSGVRAGLESCGVGDVVQSSEGGRATGRQVITGLDIIDVPFVINLVVSVTSSITIIG